ncbi:hypothetical protein SGRA_2847 [Saprospira grandis str. Lewin]|uniref:Uncharacterized protein n=1 Tax=Saprospira grandis (strain Lewin) TaxID=984262 RepID=H6LAI2_SAPGL|nr:hypothetical protein SGRA_2847 [Saprospira grandis str. Lewin]
MRRAERVASPEQPDPTAGRGSPKKTAEIKLKEKLLFGLVFDFKKLVFNGLVKGFFQEKRVKQLD